MAVMLIILQGLSDPAAICSYYLPATMSFLSLLNNVNSWLRVNLSNLLPVLTLSDFKIHVGEPFNTIAFQFCELLSTNDFVITLSQSLTLG